MLAGKTNSYHIENFELTAIQPDWKQVAIDVAKAALKLYRDKHRRKTHFRHPKQRNGNNTKKSWKAFRKREVKMLKAFLEKFDD
jgi:hypothetical protein